MKPVITYTDLKTPFGMDTPLIRKRIAKNTTRNFVNRQEFVDFVESIRPSRKADAYLVINCSCGQVYEYKNKDEIPLSDLVCGCNRKLIIYGE